MRTDMLQVITPTAMNSLDAAVLCLRTAPH